MPYFEALACRFVLWLLLISLYVPLGLQPLALADVSSASLSISVSDSSGAVIPQAEIALRNMETNQGQRSTSGKTGNATFPFLRPGHYSLTVSKGDFSDIEVDNILLNVGDEKQLNLVLKVGTTTQNITVDGGGLSINTTDASVSTVVDRKFVENIPLNGRSFQDLLSMTPGVVTTSPQLGYQSPGKNGDFSINGQRTESNYYMVDGVSANTNTGTASGGTEPGNGGAVAAGSALGTTQALLSVDALQEFRVESSTYSAEYGRSPGGQISLLSRSGTNDFHGTAFEYLRNGYFDANDWFNENLGQRKQSLHQNDFGGTLGGPVWLPLLYKGTDKTFFLASYEGLRLTQPVAASTQYVPDLYMRQQASSAVQALLNAFPKQSANGIDYGTAAAPSLAQFIQGYSLPGYIDSTGVRFDHTFTPKLSSFFRFSDTPSSVSSRVLSSLATRDFTSQTYTFGVTYEQSSGLTDEFRLGYTRGSSLNASSIDSFGGATPLSLGSALNLIPPQNTYPEIAVLISGVGLAVLGTDKSENKGTQWNLTDSAALTLKRHQLKIGVDYRRIATTTIQPPNVSTVEWTSASQALSNSAAFAYVQKLLNASSIYNQTDVFAQDQWRASSTLTFSFGLRWEVDPPPYSGNNTKPYVVLGNLDQPASLMLSAAGASLWRTSWYNFAPRFGLAWQIHNSPGRETVFRAGGGVFFDTDNEAGLQAFQGVGFNSYRIFGNMPVPFTAAQQNFAVTSTPPYSQAFLYPRHLQLPYTNQWSAAVEQGLGRSQTLSISYVAAAGRRLIQTQQIYPTNANFTSIFYIPGGGVTSNYQSLQTKFQKQMSSGLNALVSYTLSHSLDFGSNYTALPLTRGNSDFDARNNLQAGLTWDTPNLHSSPLMNNIFSEWGLDGRLLARTGFPITLQGNSAADPTTGSFYYTNVNVNPGVPIYLDGSKYPGSRVLNPGAFSLPTGSTLGNAPRNFVRGFGANQVNLAVRRHFTMSERVGLQLRAEAFNIANHPNFGYVDPTLSDANFGYATQMLNQSLGTVASQYQQGGPRSMQFALKLLF